MGRDALPGVQCAAGIRPAAAGQMPARGQQALLLKLPHPLLQAGNAGKDPRRYAVFGAEDAAVSSDFSYLAFNLQHEREAKSKGIKERYL